jgi:hypothetical protein
MSFVSGLWAVYTYQWFKTGVPVSIGGVAIAGATNSCFHHYQREGRPTSGTYSVRVTNAGGTTTSPAGPDPFVARYHKYRWWWYWHWRPGNIRPALAAPMNFTAAVYREANGETKERSFGQAAVLSVQVRFGTRVQRSCRATWPTERRVTFSTFLGRAFITPQLEGPRRFGNRPEHSCRSALCSDSGAAFWSGCRGTFGNVAPKEFESVHSSLVPRGYRHRALGWHDDLQRTQGLWLSWCAQPQHLHQVVRVHTERAGWLSLRFNGAPSGESS